MIVEFIDNVTVAAVYINPANVVSLCPDPADPAEVTLVKLQDGETIRCAAATGKSPTDSPAGHHSRGERL